MHVLPQEPPETSWLRRAFRRVFGPPPPLPVLLCPSCGDVVEAVDLCDVCGFSRHGYDACLYCLRGIRCLHR